MVLSRISQHEAAIGVDAACGPAICNQQRADVGLSAGCQRHASCFIRFRCLKEGDSSLILASFFITVLNVSVASSPVESVDRLCVGTLHMGSVSQTIMQSHWISATVVALS